MTLASRVAAAGADNFGLSIDDLLTAAKSGLLAPAAQAGPRARRRAVRASFEGGGAIAAALAVAGCKTVSSGDPSVVPGGADPGSQPGRDPTSPPTSSVYAVEESGAAPIDIGDMLAGQAGATSIVAITGVENGVAVIKGSIVYFTPTEGYSGAASISFTYRDESGRLLTGRFSINVDDDAAHAQGHHSHPDGVPSDHDHGGGHGGGSDDGAHVHPDDPGKAAEHMAVLDLVPVGEATHVAVKNGSWFDPSTWANGQVPGDGAKVVIPDGVSVLYDGESPASIFTIRVDGALNFATNKDTFLEVDTFVVTPSGSLTIGTADNPVAANVQTVISFADNGPIDVEWDPMLLSRGLVSHGEVQIHGAEKESFLRLAVDPMKGDTVLQLEAPPEGWRVGDKLVLAGTHWIETPKVPTGEVQPPATEDEELVITAIVGNKVYVDRPLHYDHDGARDDLKTYVANYSRNIRFETENPDTTPVHERGHVMFMHSDNVDVRYAEFYELGRTDKTEQSFDISDIKNVRPDSNVQGRYSLHLHRTGTADLDDPAMVVGNAVWGSPGWGYVHHDSNAIFADNAAYDVSGAAFVSELGTETGRWSDNIAIRTWGVNEHIKAADSVLGFDNGRTGVGFWFEGRMVDSVGNIAAGATEAGFIYMHRVPTNKYTIIDPSTSQQSDKLNYLDKTAIDRPNISNFLGNEVIASGTGLHVLKNNAAQGHDVRSMIVDFTAWETRIGVHLEYTSHYTIKGLDVVGTDYAQLSNSSSYGILLGTSIFDLVVADASIDGYRQGVWAWKDSIMDLSDPVLGFKYFFVDVDVFNAKTDWHNITPGEIKSGADLNADILDYRLTTLASIPLGPTKASDPHLEITGIKTDSLGSTKTSFEFDPYYISFASLRGAVEQNGYWTMQDGRKVTLVEHYIADRVTGDLIKVPVFVQLAGQADPTANNTAIRGEAEYHGVLNPNDLAPVAKDDYVTVKAGESVVIDVLANDFDPEGHDIDLDGLQMEYGYAVEREDNKVVYFADPSQKGMDTFYYWVQDDQGNMTKAAVHVMVEV